MPENPNDISLNLIGVAEYSTIIGYNIKYDYYYYGIHFAATVTGNNVTPITEANITFNTDIAGLKFRDYKKIIRINSEGLVYDKEVTPVIYAREILEDGSVSSDVTHSEFEAGKAYAFTIYFVADDGYCLPETSDDIVLTLKSAGKLSDTKTSIDHLKDYNYAYYGISFKTVVTSPSFFTRLLRSASDFFASISEFFSNLFSRICACEK